MEGFQFQPVGGAEVTDLVNGWKDLTLPNVNNNNNNNATAMVNTGALMARWTNDEWKATAHRVVVKSAAMAARHRYSLAFFADPDVGSVIDVPEELLLYHDDGTPCCPQKKKLYERTTSDAYLLEKLQAMGRGTHPEPNAL